MLKRLVMFAMVAGVMAGATSVYAQCSGAGKSCCASKHEKSSLSQLKMIDKQGVAALVRTGHVTIVDARDQQAFTAGHIEGAVNINTAQLPADKNAKLVFYCGGGRCMLSHKAAQNALAKGYKNVMVYGGGWADWNKNS